MSRVKPLFFSFNRISLVGQNRPRSKNLYLRGMQPHYMKREDFQDIDNDASVEAMFVSVQYREKLAILH